jgi:CDP-glycerol glycerophosphotransferase (TagB/SpsB family)
MNKHDYNYGTCLSTRLLFVYRLTEQLNYQASMDMAVKAFVEAGFKNITIVDLHNQCRLSDLNLVEVVREKTDFFSSVGQSDFVFCGFSQDMASVLALIPKSSKTEIINVSHGMPLRNVGFLDKAERNWQPTVTIINNNHRIHHFVASPFYSKVFSAAFVAQPSKVHEIGNLRDEIKHTELACSGRFAKFELVVFYTPTTDPYTSPSTLNEKLCFDFADDEFDKLLIKNKVCFIVKQHPLETKLNLKKFKNIMSYEELFGDVAVQKVFQIADILITDGSSVAIDFFVTGKPVILVKPSKRYLLARELLLPNSVIYHHSPANFEQFYQAIFDQEIRERYDARSIISELLTGQPDDLPSKKIVTVLSDIVTQSFV